LAWAKGVDRNHVDLGFSEQMDETSIGQLNHFVILAAGKDTLSILSAALMPGGQVARLTTENQETVDYTVIVSGVLDKAGNNLRPGSMKSFQGSLLRYTGRPRVKEMYPKDASSGVPADTSLRIEFSETMDTSATSPANGSIILLPPPADSVWRWDEQRLTISIPIISLPSHYACVYVTKSCLDYTGNRLMQWEKSAFTTTDTVPSGRISGTVTGIVPAGSELCPVGVFDSLWTPLFVDFLKGGSGTYYFGYLSEGVYRIAAGQDTDNDKEFELRGISDLIDVQGKKASATADIRLTEQTILPAKAEKVLLNFYRMNIEPR
jgi:hypothetical protein